MGKTVNELYKEDALKNIANKILEKLNAAKNKPELSAKRCVWELIQNAKDVDNIFGRVSIEIEITEDLRFIFRHNGNHFTKTEVTSLINQVSSKDSTNANPNQTGKYGTGFICTHLLSDVIDVDGIVLADDNDYRKFHLCLDRSGNSAEELIPAIERVRDTFSEIDNDTNGEKFPFSSDYSLRQKDVFGTVFTYHLTTPEKLAAAESSINDLVNTLPLTMINLSKIESVRIINQIQHTDITYKCTQTTICENIIRSEIVCPETPKAFLSYITEDVALSLEIEFRKDKRLVAIKRDDQQPVLFRDFPLIGSHKFHFPYFLNGFKFIPTEQRDDLFLHGNNNHKSSVANRQIIEKAIEASLTFNKWLIDHNLEHSYLLAASRIPETVSDPWNDCTSRPWIEKLQLDWRAKLLNQKLVEIPNGRCLLSELKVPSCKKKYIGDFYDILVPFLSDGNLPLKEDIDSWTDVLIEPKTWNKDLKYSIKDFISDLASLNNVSNLSQRLNMDTEHTFEWLNKAFAIIYEEEQIKAFQENTLIPNELGAFTCNGDQLFTDYTSTIPDPLKAVYQIAKEKDLNNILVNSRISSQDILDNIKTYNLSSFITDINGFIKNSQNKWDCRRDASYALMCLWSSEESYDYRKSMFGLTKMYSNKVQDFSQIINVPDELWTEADKLILLNTAIFIRNKERTTVTSVINTFFIAPEPIEESVYYDWFNEYLRLCDLKQCTSTLNTEKIFADQKGNLHTKNELFYDNNIDDSFKDLTEKIGTLTQWRSILLNKKIHGFETHQAKSNADIYKDVKDTFSHDTQKQILITKEALSRIPISEKEKPSHLQTAYSIMNSVYNDMPDISYVNSYEGFHWTTFINSSIFFVSKIIADCINISNLAKCLSTNLNKTVTEKNTLVWIDDFIKFVKSLDNETAWGYITTKNGHGVWPNQHNDFCMYNDVYVDKDILEDVKDLTETNQIVKHDYRAELLNQSSDLAYLLPKLNFKHTNQILEIIDQQIEEFDKNGNKQSKAFSSLVFTLEKIYKDHKLEKIMNFYESQRYRMIVGSLNEGETMEIIGRLVSEPKKLNLTKQLINNVEDEDRLNELIELSKLGVTPERYKELLAIEASNKVFTGAFIDQRSPEAVERDIKTGRKGEEIVYNLFKSMANIKSVSWKNEMSEAYGPYDLVATTCDEQQIFIEVKSTTTAISRANEISIPISTNEWTFSTELGKKGIYCIIRVFDVYSENPLVYLLESKPLGYEF